MKIAIVGYSGSGKSTLAGRLGEAFCAPVLCLDRLHWLPGWTERPDQAADTQREIARRLEELIRTTWRARPIGEQIRVDEAWSTVRDVPNVRAVRQILPEGAYDHEGHARLVPLDGEAAFPYGVAESGTHLVRVL